MNKIKKIGQRIKKWWTKERLLIVFILLLALILRIWNFGENPPSLYVDEVAIAYDAYSIAETGADYWGNKWPIVAFKSYDDWKPSLYFYLASIAIKIGGLNEISLRFPSLMAGIFMVWGVYVLVKELLKIAKTENKYWPMASMLMVAINPWAIHFSRVGFEANVAAALVLWGVICWLKAIKITKFDLFSVSRRHTKLILGILMTLGTGLLILSLYTYHASKIVAPILGIIMAIWWFVITWRNLKLSNKKENTIIRQIKLWLQKYVIIILPMIIFNLILLCPIMTELFNPSVQDRWQETNILADNSEPVAKSNACREKANNSFLSRFYCHRYLYYSPIIIENYLANLNPNFLFFNGDGNRRHSTGLFGLFYPTDLLFLIVGIIYSLRQQKIATRLLLTWLLISLVPAGISIGAPHAIRIVLGLPTWIILMGLGLTTIFNLIKSIKIKWRQFLLKFLLIIIISLPLGIWYIHYHKVYPANNAIMWQSGYEQLYQKIEQILTQNPDIERIMIDKYYPDNDNAPARMYYFYHKKVNPLIVQNYLMNQIEKENDSAENFFIDENNREFIFIGGSYKIRTDKSALLVFRAHEKENLLTELIKKNEKLKITPVDTIILPETGEGLWNIYWLAI